MLTINLPSVRKVRVMSRVKATPIFLGTMEVTIVAIEN
jgi:hypothetical protein